MNVKEELKSMAWVEKYRPQKVSEVISEHTAKVQRYIQDDKSMPNFLFESRTGGTGKTSLAKAIINEMGVDHLSLNASADRSIEGVRQKVRGFIMGRSVDGRRRCVLFDEAEKMSKDALDALKNMIEEYSKNAFFIFTTNSVNKINGPIRSRFVEMEFSSMNKDDVKQRLTHICESEGLEYDDEGLDKILKINYPSVRKMINTLQDLHVQGLKVSIENITNPDDKYKELFALLQNSSYNALKQRVYEDNVDVDYFNRWIFQHLMKGGHGISLKAEVLIVQSLAKNTKAFSTGADKQIVFLAESINIMKALRG